jgi:hypothetical protein
LITTRPDRICKGNSVDEFVAKIVFCGATFSSFMVDNRALIPEGCDEFLRGLKERIRTAQVKAALAVNRELVLLYWGIGQDILERQRHSGWGGKSD